MVKTFPCRPSRCCLNSTGPGEEILTASAVIRSRGERITKAISERTVSINRFQNLLYTAFRSYPPRRSSVQSGGISVHPANRNVPPEKRGITPFLFFNCTTYGQKTQCLTRAKKRSGFPCQIIFRLHILDSHGTMLFDK